MKLNRIWIIASLILIIILSILTHSSILQVIAAVTGVIYVFGCAYENKYGQLFGVINSILYGYIMFSNGVYGTAIYDIIYCAPMQAYTYFTWGKDRHGNDRTEISRLTSFERIVLLILLTLVIGIYCIVATKLNVQYALVDGISIILGIVGLYMTSRKKIEQWYAFIISNIVMLAFWCIKSTQDISNVAMLAMWVIYLVNNCYGLYSWSKKIKNKENVKNTENAAV